MKPDDKDPPGYPEGGSAGRPEDPAGDPGKGGDDMIEAQESKAARSNPPGSRPGGGNSALLDRDPPKGGEDPVAEPDLKTVKLVCLFCRDVRLIHVPKHCDTPREVLWECLACQERWATRR